MKLLKAVAIKAALALIATDVAFADVLTTIDTYIGASDLSIGPITVSSKYQTLPEGEPTTASTGCSTASPSVPSPLNAWNGSMPQVTTDAEMSQPSRVIESIETLSTVTAVSSKRNWFDFFGGKEDKDSLKRSAAIYKTVVTTSPEIAPSLLDRRDWDDWVDWPTTSGGTSNPLTSSSSSSLPPIDHETTSTAPTSVTTSSSKAGNSPAGGHDIYE
ncbi:hypothetical protein A1O3_05464 [Capronia epimyces CBS 606.96]|uniref:Uncharacterized protein n=1 Tax=Capronia epimyces CBS 606.96 TaxID=1182542 RepID=W9XW48_9EURO|nr:uncharacterized protein A1O3_05464 [Capronia epimyces CBS 606.96]EXJ84792.1 hypothetical protein A1O3_05464 [Capronia epimyces CBS 606.96]